LQREILLKILAIELLIVAFVRFQMMGVEREKNETVPSSGSDDNGKFLLPQEDKKSTINVYEIVTKSKNFVESVKPYLCKRDQYYVDIFSKIAEIIEIQKDLMNLSQEEIEAMDKTQVDKIGILKAIKPYIAEDKQIIIDKFLKFHEALKNLQQRLEKYTKEEDKDNFFDKIVDIYEAIRPIIPEEKIEETDKIAKNIKLLEVLNKAEGIMNSMKEEKKQSQQATRDFYEEITEEEEEKSEEIKEIEVDLKEGEKDEEEMEQELPNKEENLLPQGMSEQQLAAINNLKSMLTKEQQQYMYNMINYLKQQGLVNLSNKEKSDLEKGE
jgi:hypothetical protein